jgi:hypothetical protein
MKTRMGLAPQHLMYGYGWKNEELFRFLYDNDICNNYSTLSDWIYRRTPKPTTLMQIYKAYIEYSATNPPQYPQLIKNHLLPIDDW